MSSLSILITNIFNFPSVRLLTSILFSSFSEVLFRSFIWAMFLFLFIFWQFLFFTVVQEQLSAFSTHHSPSSHPSPPSTLDTNPLWLCPCVLYTCSWWPFPLFPPLCPPRSALVTANLFFILMSLVLFCSLLFCWLGSTYRWDHMVFVFHHLAHFT